MSKNRDFNQTNIQISKESEKNSGDSIKRLEDEGLEMLPLSEAKDYIAQEVAKQVALIEQKRKEDEAVKKALGELEAQKKEQDFNSLIRNEAAKFDEIIRNDARVSLAIRRKRNKYGASLELKKAMYNNDGSLRLNRNGKPVMTEYIQIVLNNRKFEYEIGPDMGDAEPLIMIMDVPWSVACALAEKRYPQVLINPKTGEKFLPQRAFKPTPTTVAPIVNEQGLQLTNSSHEAGGYFQTEIMI